MTGIGGAFVVDVEVGGGDECGGGDGGGEGGIEYCDGDISMWSIAGMRGNLQGPD